MVTVGFDTEFDLSLISSPAITVVGEGDYVITVTVEYPSSSGQLMLGTVGPTEEIDLSYTMTAEVDGVASFTSAIAAIHDPFFLSDSR